MEDLPTVLAEVVVAVKVTAVAYAMAHRQVVLHLRLQVQHQDQR
jgi:hypothetical protein